MPATEPMLTMAARPEALRAGCSSLVSSHAEVAKWRRRQDLLLTAQRRPDLLSAAEPSDAERRWLAEQGVVT